jgi:hypothetical protein
MNFKAMTNRNQLRRVGLPLLLLLPVLVCSYKLKAQKKNDRACLEISGKVMGADQPNRQLHVYLIEENRVIDSALAEAGAEFSFRLQKNRYYAIRIRQEGCVPRLVSISTYLPADVREKLFRFHFDLYPLAVEDSSEEISDVLDFPIALIKYDEVKAYFDYNAQYTAHIKNAYYRLKAETKLLFTTSL